MLSKSSNTFLGSGGLREFVPFSGTAARKLNIPIGLLGLVEETESIGPCEVTILN